MSNAKTIEHLAALVADMTLAIQKLEVAPKPRIKTALKTAAATKKAAPAKAALKKAAPKKAAPKKAAPAKAAPKKAAGKMYRPSFFKKIFMEDRQKFMGILWTSKEIQRALAMPEVSSKKDPEARYAKVSRILYEASIKADEPKGRKAKFEIAFAEFNA